jgi:hypothetical protein
MDLISFVPGRRKAKFSIVIAIDVYGHCYPCSGLPDGLFSNQNLGKIWVNFGVPYIGKC